MSTPEYETPPRRAGGRIWTSVAESFRAAGRGLLRVGRRVRSGAAWVGRAFVRVFQWPAVSEFGLGVTAIVIWLLLFTAGMVVNSSAFSNALDKLLLEMQTEQSFAERFGGVIWGFTLVLFVLLTYTVSNVAVLALLSSLIGMCAARLQPVDATDPRPRLSLGRHSLSVMTGAFLIYLVGTSGSYTLLNLPFKTPEIAPSVVSTGGDRDAARQAEQQRAAVQAASDRYKTFATIISIVCLIEGFQPFAIRTVNRLFRRSVPSEVSAPGGQPPA